MIKCIVGKIVTLKPLREQYFEVYHHMFSHVVRKAIGLPLASDLQETATFLKATMTEKQHLMFDCIFDNKTDALIGAIVIRSKDHPNGQLGSWLNEHFWGGERYQEALYLAMKQYFESTSDDSIFAFIAEDNERSLRAHQKFGFEVVEKTSAVDKNCFPDKKTKKVILRRAVFKTKETSHA